jgi:hypothetical protein
MASDERWPSRLVATASHRSESGAERKARVDAGRDQFPGPVQAWHSTVQRYHVGLRIDDRVDEVRELLKGEAHLIAKMITVVDRFDAGDEVTQAAFANFAGHACSAHQAAAGPSRNSSNRLRVGR